MDLLFRADFNSWDFPEKKPVKLSLMPLVVFPDANSEFPLYFGGGAIIAPFCVSILHIPVFTIAGPAMFGTFMTSIAGVFFYSIIPINSGRTAPPDWLLGFLFGIGGLVGMYLGARCQKFVPEKIIKLILALIILAVSLKYIVQFF